MHDIVILGGGIAGLSAGVLAQLHGKKALVFNDEKSRHNSGHGFILQQNGMNVLEQLRLGEKARTLGHEITNFELRSAAGNLLYQTKLNGVYGFLRKNFITMLESGINPSMLQNGKRVKNIAMEPQTKKISSIILEDGSAISARLFIDAAGKKSLLRKILFPNLQLFPGKVSEILCTIHSSDIAKKLKGTFIKFSQEEGNLSVGLVPCNEDTLVWYCQFNAQIYANMPNTPSAIETFCYKHLAQWCPLIQKVLECTDFNSAYLWNTEDFDLLPYLHGENCVLVGDAAHLFLTFTSQGVSSALQDIQILFNSLLLPYDLPQALENYTQLRIPELKRILLSGRELRDKFFQPLTKFNTIVPLC